MATHTTKPRRPSGPRNLASYWRLAYSWRWGESHPTPQRQAQKWFMTASGSFKALRVRRGVDNHWIKRLIEWYFTWWTFGENAATAQRLSQHPAILNATTDDGTEFIIESFLKWCSDYAYMLSDKTIAQVARQFKGHTHVSNVAGPWEVEDSDRS